MFYINVNGVKTACEVFGDPSKPAIILGHGGTTSSTGYRFWLFNNFAQRLAEDYYVVCYDRRCHGLTGFPESFTMCEQCEDVFALMDALCIEKATYVGISAGTYIGGALGGIAPERLSSLILIVPHSHAEGATPARQLANKLGMSPADPEFLKAADRAAYAPETTDEMKAAYNKFNASTEVAHFTEEQIAAAYAAMAYFDNRPIYKTLEVPTLVISGKYDGFCPPEVGKEIAETVKNGEYVLLNAGHCVFNEKNDELLEVIRSYLKKIV